MGDVLELEARSALCRRRESKLDPADFTAVLPGRSEAARRIAPFDGATGIALELVATAHPQLTGDG